MLNALNEVKTGKTSTFKSIGVDYCLQGSWRLSDGGNMSVISRLIWNVT